MRMRDIYLGDSYDIVKRFWSHIFRPISPLYAHARFVPAPIRQGYETITSIPVAEMPPKESFGILLDPHTGIPLPGGGNRRPTASHAPLEFIVQLIGEWRPLYVITFDQSYHRRHKLNREQQRAAKMAFLASANISSIFYVSHAPFLICSNVDGILSRIRGSMIASGIPESRLETYDA